jgi:hypothetical protein
MNRSHKASPKNRTTAFMRVLCRELESACSSREWKEPGRPAGVKGDSRNVDVIGASKDGRLPTVLIEVELRRRSTVKNVVKVWQWATNGGLPGPFILIQAFSAFYRSKEGKGDRADAEFIGRQMAASLSERCRYESRFVFPYQPKGHSKRGGGARDKQAKALATEVKRLLEQELVRAAGA